MGRGAAQGCEQTSRTWVQGVWPGVAAIVYSTIKCQSLGLRLDCLASTPALPEDSELQEAWLKQRNVKEGRGSGMRGYHSGARANSTAFESRQATP